MIILKNTLGFVASLDRVEKQKLLHSLFEEYFSLAGRIMRNDTQGI